MFTDISVDGITVTIMPTAPSAIRGQTKVFQSDW